MQLAMQSKLGQIRLKSCSFMDWVKISVYGFP